ncbi:MAG: glycerophosphoryl diester phosphodiesterase [Haloarculaceae archaeon]
MRCIAHRGFAGVNPENTLQALRDAAAAGADAVEIDVRRCGSGEVVVVHDETVDRVSDGRGRVADLPLETLADLDVLDTGQGVPTLREAFATVPGDVTVNVELKERGLAGDVLAVADEYDSDVLVSSFDPQALREVRAAGSVPVALLFAEEPRDRLDTAAGLHCRAVHPHWRLCDAEFVSEAHATGFDVNAWTIQSPEVARDLQAVDVDGLIADTPHTCRR